MDDQIRADAFLKRLVKAIPRKEKPVLTPERTQSTNLTPDRKQRIATNQIRQRRVNQMERQPGYHAERVLSAVNADPETKRRIAANVAGKRDPYVVRETHFQRSGDLPREERTGYHYVPTRHVMEPATKPERLRGLAENERRRVNRTYTEAPEAVLRKLQHVSSAIGERIPMPRRYYPGEANL